MKKQELRLCLPQKFISNKNQKHNSSKIHKLAFELYYLVYGKQNIIKISELLFLLWLWKRGKRLGIDSLVVNHLQGMIWIFDFKAIVFFFFGPVNYFFILKQEKKDLLHDENYVYQSKAHFWPSVTFLTTYNFSKFRSC